MFNEYDFEELVYKTLAKNGWKYIPAEELPRKHSDVLVESMVKDALIRLNPVIAEEPSRADEVLQQVRAIILSVEPHSLVTHNEQFKNLVFENNSFHFGKDGRDVPITFFGTGDDAVKNEYVVTNQWVYPRAEGGKRLDIVLLINGFPVVIGELKTPTREAISWMDGAGDILAYEKSIPQMFVTNVFNFASEGKTYRYSSINAPLTVWGPWHTEEHKSEGTLKDVEHSITDMITPEIVMDIFRFYTLYATDKEYRKYKIICRYQQFEGANMIVERVVKGYPKQGLIWHFQGSGKSLLMVFAAQKLRMTKSLNNPTVLIVDDRIDLETQMTATFNASDIPNLEKAYSGERLEQLLKSDTRKIIITTIFKFNDVKGCLNARDNIILMVDEAHRTQEGSLGEKMRSALPNAFFFGLTGTPINKRDRNTFHAFGAVEDRTGYMSKYSFADSIRDGATLPLNFEPVPVELHVNQDVINEEFDDMAKEAGLTRKQQADVIARVRIEAIMKNPERIKKVCAHIAEHFKTKIEPNGFKGQVVCYDRECCLLYKQELDKILGEEASTIVMDTNNDKEDRYKEWRRDRDEESKVLDKFRNPRTKLKLVIVTSKLLTGFDAPILQVMYLDKPMKDHTLLQAICRTNRVYGHDKNNGLIVDYVGIFDDVAKALDFDEKSVQTVISNIEAVKKEIPRLLATCLEYFPGVDRTVEGWEGLIAAQECLPTSKEKDKFGADYRVLNRAFNAVSPDPFLRDYLYDYKWLSKVYESVRPTDNTGALIWSSLGAKTIDLVNQHIDVSDVQPATEADILELDSELIEAFIQGDQGAKKRARKIEIDLVAKINAYTDDPKFISIGEKLERLREQQELGLITSIEFLKKLLELAREAAEAEKEVVPVEEIDKGKAALTELFTSIKNSKTPVIVERIVNDIDEIVKIVRFDGWQDTGSGRREVKKALRSIVAIKYKIKDTDVFDKAYNYIEMYY